jgi:hypothetical protein
VTRHGASASSKTKYVERVATVENRSAVFWSGDHE